MASRLPAVDPAEVEVVLTPMRRRHLRGVLRIEAQVYPRPWSLGLFMGELALRASRVYLVARSGATVIGYGGLMLVGSDGHVTTMAVDPAWHRLGVGTRLLLGLARAAQDYEVDQLTLEVRESNLGAQALYQRFGFEPAGIRRGYYAESGEDAVVMWAHDVRSPAYRARLDEIERAIPGTTIHEGFT
jgi:[ribosomal protein S18]-alanine N-acetyltransferase